MNMLRLYWVFLQVGLWSIGGGYASIPILSDLVVEKHAWISMEEFVDMVTVSQMTPGPIAINLATFVGIRMEGLWGGIVATLGSITPATFIMMPLAYFYFKYHHLFVIKAILSGLRPVVVSLIASALAFLLSSSLFSGTVDSWWNTDLHSLDLRAAFLFLGSMGLLKIWKGHPIGVMAMAGIVGAILYGF
jgi:chromate transporter